VELEMTSFELTPPVQEHPVEAIPDNVALDCYLGALTAIGRAAAEICPHIGISYQNSLVRLRQRIAFSPKAATLTHSIASLESDLDTFAANTASYYNRKTGSVASLLNVIAQAVEYFETRDYIMRERLSLIARQMQAGLELTEEVAELRKTYEIQLGHLTGFVDKLSAEGATVFEGLQKQIGAIENSLIEAEVQAGVDPLTSFVDRSEMDRLIRARVLTEKKFSLLIFEIDGFSSILDSIGQPAGDQIIQQFASRLAAQVRPRDVIARWADDRFAVIFDCSAIDAGARAHQVAQWVSGPYPVVIDAGESKADVAATVIVHESDPKETADEFLVRANAR
jgi:diguanylate cyclase (GGDEF)-like protein